VARQYPAVAEFHRGLCDSLSRPVLEAPLHELVSSKPEEIPEPITLKGAERAHIVRALEKTKGQLAGAATLLGVPSLYSLLHYSALEHQHAQSKKGRSQLLDWLNDSFRADGEVQERLDDVTPAPVFSRLQ
jgi:hypothetical protein